MKKKLILSVLCLTGCGAGSSLAQTQAIQVNGEKVGIGTAPGSERLEVSGNQTLSGFLKFPSTYGNANDGKLGNSMFAQGFNLVGINNDNTYRKIRLWGEITQQENPGTNTWGGANVFTGNVRLSSLGAGVLGTDGAGNLSILPSGGSGANVVLRTASNGYLYLDNWIRATGLFKDTGEHAFFDGSYFQTRTSNGIRVTQVDGTSRGFVYFDGAENFGLLNKAGNWAVRTTNSDTILHNNVYVARLLDYDDGSFYLDANGTSRINRVLANTFDSINAGRDSGLSGVRSYEWGYQEAGPWTHPYPDLVIGYHTGLKLGGYYGYGGTRFYSDHPSHTSDMIFSVGNGDGNVRVTNSLFVGGQTQASSFRSTSSQRWKEEVATMKNPLELIRQLRGVTYKWKAGTSQQGQSDIGFIAEEIVSVLPAVVGKDDEGKPASVDYGRVSSVLVEAVKEVDTRTATLNEQLAALRAEVSALKQATDDQARSKYAMYILVAAAGCIGLLVGRWISRRNT
jgi:hypothetical protein